MNKKQPNYQEIAEQLDKAVVPTQNRWGIDAQGIVRKLTDEQGRPITPNPSIKEK